MSKSLCAPFSLGVTAVRAGNDALLRVQLLGPVRAWLGQRELDLGAPQQRAVFGMLAMRANRTVSRSDLIDGVWGQEPPVSAVNGVHVYVAGLRRALEPDRAHRAPGQALLADAGGYMLRLEPGQPDTEAFSQLLAQARESGAAGDLATAARLLDAASRLWRADPLSGIPGPWAEIERVRLRELRLNVIEESVDAMLARGRHADAATKLAGLVREHPLRERFRGQLMLALYRCERQAEALAVYAETRSVLVEELGVEPGPELRRLHERLLLADDALGLPAAAGTARAAPAQLPADVDAFTGRAVELAELDRLLPSLAMAIFTVSGTAGVGKTALAVRWAHRIRGRFPDGQLFVNLRGYDPDRPVSAADALAGFLRALGMAPPDIPARIDERAAAYRTLLDGRRVVVVLDNAATVEQVRPLLPGSPSCVVVVTSRDSLPGLVARHGARRLDLDLLPPRDAVGLLRALIGDRVDAEPVPAAILAEECSRLPLALRIAAELAVARPSMTVTQLADELADQQRLIDLLDAGGDPRTAVRSVFSWSYSHLSADAARAFRVLGLHLGPDIDQYAAAALIAARLGQSRHLLDLLARAHLIEDGRQGRYGLYDLLRTYAAEVTSAEDSEDERHAALTRLFDYYLSTAAAAMDAVFPAERGRRPRILHPATPVPAMSDPARARNWLDTERVTLAAVIGHAATHGWPRHAILLAATLFRYLDTGNHHADAVALHGHARDAARASGDAAAEATALSNLGVAHWRQGIHDQAVGNFQQALTVFRKTGSRTGEARALGNLGLIHWRRGCYQQAAGQHEQALAIFREIGDQTGVARALNNLGTVYLRQGLYEEAARHHDQALALFREIGDRTGEARALNNLGSVEWQEGRYVQAAAYHEQALALFREVGDRFGEADALASLGCVYERQGRGGQAASHHEQALALFREIGDRTGEAEALNRLGEVLLVTGRPGEAHATYLGAVALGGQIGDTYEAARAHDGLARSQEATDRPGPVL